MSFLLSSSIPRVESVDDVNEIESDRASAVQFSLKIRVQRQVTTTISSMLFLDLCALHNNIRNNEPIQDAVWQSDRPQAGR